MKIQKITLTNFRAYKGSNTVSFDVQNQKNINIIAGKNGFGKTTFLTSLIWGFYGKMIAEVEDKYRNDIRNSGGYEKFLRTLLNRDVRNDFETDNRNKGSFSVDIELSNISIPSIPCESVVISRSYDFNSNQEDLRIVIDGLENELTKEVGYEVFINDFILPREIAKFFFFDAEKIVSLAEAKTTDELKNLSKAYSEVLGIKKYEDLKKNLETLISKLKRASASPKQQTRLISFFDEKEQLEGEIELIDGKLHDIDSELNVFKLRSDGLQEKLIREGNAITLEELGALKDEQDELKEASIEIKSKLKRLLDVAPLVIAGPALMKLEKQVTLEREHGGTSLNQELILEELQSFSKNILKEAENINLPNTAEVEQLITSILDKRENDLSNKSMKADVLVDFSIEQVRNFEALLNNIKTTFASQFSAVVQEERINKTLLNRVMHKIKQAEARKDNPLAQKLREEKISVDTKIETLQTEKGKLLAKLDSLNLQLNSAAKMISEYEKDVRITQVNAKKYEVAQTTLSKITTIIQKIKEDKKYSLQKSILFGLNKIMHKSDFVHDVRVNVYEDIMDIDLLDKKGQLIDKDSLSKGEQQLYATALLKALVDESGIQFPVFIDSPLQKFDKHHSKNIIQEFYPAISEQVVLFPLLEKELSETEFSYMKGNVNQVYLIENKDNNSSFREMPVDRLFEQIKQEEYVHTN